MQDDISNQLLKAKLALQDKDKFDSVLRRAIKTVENSEAQMADFEKAVARKQKDVQRLEGDTLVSRLSSLFGTKDNNLRREHAELNVAQLNLEKAIDSLKKARETVEQLRQKCNQFEAAEYDYERLFTEKARLVKTGGGDAAEALKRFEEEIGQLIPQRPIVELSLQKGELALRSLHNVIAELKSAIGWGRWDLFLGGGFTSSRVKFANIRAANDYAKSAQTEMLQFEESLEESLTPMNLDLQISLFTQVVDGFSNLSIIEVVADWVIHAKIKNALAASSATTESVQTAVDQCRRRLALIGATIDSLNLHRRELVEQSELHKYPTQFMQNGLEPTVVE
jgi:tetratricopeptide (TPR) repeat protein